MVWVVVVFSVVVNLEGVMPINVLLLHRIAVKLNVISVAVVLGHPPLIDVDRFFGGLVLWVGISLGNEKRVFVILSGVETDFSVFVHGCVLSKYILKAETVEFKDLLAQIHQKYLKLQFESANIFLHPFAGSSSSKRSALRSNGVALKNLSKFENDNLNLPITKK